MLIDTHAHLADNKILPDIDYFMTKAFENDVKKIISIGCSLDEIKECMKISDRFDNVYFSAGLYPLPKVADFSNSANDIETYIDSFEQHIPQFSEKFVAIGECGLDYSAPPPTEFKLDPVSQHTLFKWQIEKAIELNKPIIIHSRNAVDDTIKILKSYGEKLSSKAVWHCFTEDESILKQIVEMGIMISITGIITYKSADSLANAVKSIGLENIMLETDAPYLTPEPIRSEGIKINNPQYVRIIADKIAEIKGISYDEVAEQTTRNAKQFFKI